MDPVITVCLNPAVDRVLEVSGFRAGGHHAGRERLTCPAGKGVNLSRALATLGIPSIVIGFVGEDRFEEFERTVNQARLCQSQFLRVSGRTRENITIIDPQGRPDTHVRLQGLAISDDQLGRFQRKLSLLVREDRVVVFAGSLPVNIENETFRELVEFCVLRGARVVVETEAGPLGAVRDLSLWLVKPSAERLSGLVGEPIVTEEEIVRHATILNRAIQTVIVTCGAAGAYIFVDGSAMMGQVQIEPERVRSTVGCGDAMLAGYLAGRLNGADIRESFRQSLAAAGAAAVGVRPGEIDEATIEELLFSANVVPVQAVRSRGG